MEFRSINGTADELVRALKFLEDNPAIYVEGRRVIGINVEVADEENQTVVALQLSDVVHEIGKKRPPRVIVEMPIDIAEEYAVLDEKSGEWVLPDAVRDQIMAAKAALVAQLAAQEEEETEVEGS